MEPNGSKLFNLYVVYDQWKEEHEQLRGRLADLNRYMKLLPTLYGYNEPAVVQGEIRTQFEDFMTDWQRHLSEERFAVYPVVESVVCGGRIGPAAVLLENGHLADEFFLSYVNACEQGAAVEETFSRLLQVLMIVAEHFRIEDETVVPLAERLMDEIAYCGS